MPKNQSRSAWLRDWINRIDGNSIYTTDGKVIFCQACGQQAPSDKLQHLKQHNDSAKHTANVQRHQSKEQKQKQQFLKEADGKVPDQFSFDLCQAMVAANIPFNKLENQTFRKFLDKYCGKAIPSGQTMRNYLELNFKQKIDQIKKEFANSYFWFSVDETTDKQGRSIANLLIGKLDGIKWHPPRLISVKSLEKVDFASIARFVNESLETIVLNKEKGLLAVTDGAAYMKKSIRHLKIFYPNLVHITCLAHGLHRVAEKIRDIFPGPDKLIAKTKQVFVKAASRVRKFREEFPGVPLPPKPILTRWTTWISAVSYYNEYFENIKTVVSSFDPTDAACIREAIECFTAPVWQDLAYIHANFGGLCGSITKLETQGLSIHESLEIFANVRNQMESAIGEKSIEIRQKFDLIVEKNPGIEIMARFCEILSGNHAETNVPANLIPFYKFAPLTSCDVERSFSIYKTILSDNRMRFTMENLEMYLICNCNQS